MSRLHPLCLFSKVASRLISSGVHSHDLYRNFCSVCTVTIVNFGHLTRSFYLLTYLLTLDSELVCYLLQCTKPVQTQDTSE